MKRRRVTPSVAGGAVEASLENIGAAYNNHNDPANALVAASLPRIPGLSMEHVPTFLHVLQVTTKFFQKDCKTESFTVVDWEDLQTKKKTNNGIGVDGRNSESTSHPNGNQSIHDSIMNRMNAVSNNNNSEPTTTANEENHKRRFIQAVNTWLEEVQYHARRRRKQSEPNDGTTAMGSTSTENFKGKSSEKPVPYSMFLYLWDMQQEHKRVTVRRSALFLSGLLLARSKDCRYHIDQETHLADWVLKTGIKIEGSDSGGGANSSRKILQLGLLQKEAMVLLSHLLDQGHGKRYVKLAVAAKSLKHRCMASMLQSGDYGSTPPGMANWRKLRDFAMLHGHREIRKVGKLLDLADECLEILVPRIDGIRRPSRSWKRSGEDQKGGEQKSEENQQENDNEKVNGGDDDLSDSDDDDIDWEDGDEMETNHANSITTEQHSHLSAVESTMAAMEKTAGNTLFSGGRLEINFDRRVDEDTTTTAGTGTDKNAADEKKARRTMQKIVSKLATRHLVRLSAWLDGLRNSDNLVAAESASLVALSPAKDELRRELIGRLSALKQDVSTVLSSASRLNIRGQNKDTTNIGEEQTTTSETNTGASDQNRSAVVSLEGMPAAPASRAELGNKRLSK
eukprot:CAMPEP_0116136364 /NCGR_PEP_ID=MMETSP0329-20121206/11684_1 /TAXON_ID=697910 /ORGANISM="Pseudo-nitzschia arenysensis, Strain B593" /LENGTH=623 /DNA_ID=CAMNT_0003631225 /DNA_START=49 /DNA_END=1917 /DNA_ORIENTATION=+